MSAPDWLAALRAADAGPLANADADTLAALALGIGDPPTPQALAAWWPECPDPVKAEAVERLRTLARVAEPDAPGELVDALGFKVFALPVIFRTEGAEDVTMDGPHLFGQWPSDTTGRVIGGGGRWIRNPRNPANLSRRWIEARQLDGCPGHPLAPIVRAWIERPEDETAVSRPDPILARIEVRERPERVAGKLAFGVAARDAPEDPGQLPLIDAPDMLRVPLLELCDWYGVPVTQQGGGAPHALAVYVSAMLVTPLNDGRGERSIIATVRDLKEHLFPGRWNPSRDWPRIRGALIVADSLVIPEVYRTPSGFRQPWRAVALRTCPGEVWERGMLDAEIRLAVEHPPNASGNGPILERAELARLRASDGPKYRAYIGAHSLLWRPGATRVKYRGRWYWTRDRNRYPILTAADRDRIAFASEGERRKHSRAVKDAAWEDLSGIRILDRAADTLDGRRGWRIAPEGAGPE